MPPSLLFLQNIYLSLELRMRRDAPRLRQYLTTLHLILTYSPQKHPYIVSRQRLIQNLPKHLHTGSHRLYRRPQPDYLYLLPRPQYSPLYLTRHHRTTTTDRKYVLDRHQKRLVYLPLRLRYVLVHRLHQLPYRTTPLTILLTTTTLKRLKRTAPYHRRIVPIISILAQQLPHL
ncbi:hypothetical protein TDIS_2134 [Thermosulfurimonas dismutans]|uniref:Uncharacterized protein n=1 Tax=Thermosulfurimonas dismutans TaxID=999894 RepID=A0A179D141_9BACT|nr:hypothetical protein TDIS_2134 [Thermosulfurimonas dismutans]